MRFSILDAAEYRKRIDRKFPGIDAVVDGSAGVIIYPAARMGRHAAAQLRRDGLKILAFGDGNPAFVGNKH